MTSNIGNIINIEKCSQTISGFSKTFRINTSILDNDGNRIVPINPEYSCVLDSSSKEDYTSKCIGCDKLNIEKVLNTGTYIVSSCWCGATTITAPVYIEGKIAGFVKAGKFLTKKLTDTKIKSIAKEHQLDKKTLSNCLNNLTILPEDRIEDLTSVLVNFASQLSDDSLRNIRLENDINSHKTLLKSNESKLKLALNTMNFGVLEFDIDEKRFYFDENSLNIIGAPCNPDGSLPPMYFADFCKTYIPESNIGEVQAILADAVKDYEIKHFNFQYKRHGKELRWLEVDTYRIDDETTGKKLLIGLYRDITDRNRKDIRIAQQNHSLQSLTLNKEISSGNLNRGFKEIAINARNTLEVDNVCFWLYDTATDYLCGYEPLKNQDRMQSTRTISFSTALELLTSEDNSSNLLSIEDTTANHNTAKYMDEIFKPFNIRSMLWATLIINREFRGIISYEMSDSPRKWFKEEGDYALSLARITASAFEIKDRIRAQEDLSESQKLAHVSHFSWDVQKNTIHGSDEYFRIFELEPETDVTLEDTLNRIHPDDRKTGESAFLVNSIPDSLHRNDEIRLMMPDERVKFISRKLRYILKDSKELIRIIGTIQDITERKESEKKLIEAISQAKAANRSKSDFLANMSHEIRTPLNIITGMINLALDTNMTQTQYSYLSKASKASKSLLGIINDILDFSKVEAGKLSIEMIPFNIKEIAENVITNVSIAMESTRFELILDIDHSIPSSIIGDPLRINQVLTNLLSNAVKFTNKGEVILKINQVSHQKDMIKLMISVKDTGIGMNKDQQAKLFHSFNQADPSITRKHGGTGLGLAISKQLINLMGGDIELVSETGLGSVFSFELEFEIDQEEDISIYQSPDDLKGSKIILVDDNASFRDVTTQQLRSFGFKPDHVESGSKALTMIDNAISSGSPYDIAIINWDMPGVNGIETAEAILNKHYATPPRLIMTISHNTEQAITEVEKTGVQQVLTKPVLPLNLLRTIIDCLTDEKTDLKKKINKRNEIPDFTGKKILLVEDNILNQEIATALLKKTHAEIAVAYNGLEGVGMARSDEYDAILMDVQMPIMDGLNATRAIRKFDTTTPIFAMTAHAISGDKEKSISSGMNDHITKPVNPPLLYSTLKNYLGDTSATAQDNKNTVSETDQSWGLGPDSTVTEDSAESESSGIERIIEYKKAVELLDNDEELYKEVLSMFINDYSSNAGEIREHYNAGRLEDAHRIAHTFKGVAGNIGAPRLKSIATDLDKKFKSGLTSLDSEINEFCNEIEETIKLINKLDLS